MKKLLLILFIFFCLAGAASAQNRTISGTITGQDDGLPLPGVINYKAVSLIKS